MKQPWPIEHRSPIVRAGHHVHPVPDARLGADLGAWLDDRRRMDQVSIHRAVIDRHGHEHQPRPAARSERSDILAAVPKRPPRVVQRAARPARSPRARADARTLEGRRGGRAVARRRLRRCSAGSRTARSISSSPIRRTRSRRPSGTSSSRSRCTSSGAIAGSPRSRACSRRTARPTSAASPRSSPTSRRAARRRFASCRWLVWYYRNKANLGRDWGRSHESILHLRKATREARRRCGPRPVQRPHHEVPGARAGGVVAVRRRGRAARSLGAEPARRQAARRDRDAGDLQRHGREDAARDAEARGADREADPRPRARPASSSSIRSSARAPPRSSPRGSAGAGSPAMPMRATSGSPASACCAEGRGPGVGIASARAHDRVGLAIARREVANPAVTIAVGAAVLVVPGPRMPARASGLRLRCPLPSSAATRASAAGPRARRSLLPPTRCCHHRSE